MKDWTAIRQRYLRDGLQTRLGGLAANLGRIRSFAARGSSDEAVESLIDESKQFIEWTAAEAEVNIAAELVQLQIGLALWHLSWRRTRDVGLRERIVDQAGVWSDRVLEMSGLLG